MRRRWGAVATAVVLLSGCVYAAGPVTASDPSPWPSSPTWQPGTVVPSVATCPDPPTPHDPGPTVAASLHGPAVFDTQSARVITLSGRGFGGGFGRSAPVSYDVCTDTSQSMGEVPWPWLAGGHQMVYDPGTDAVLAFWSEPDDNPVDTYSPVTHQWTESREPQKLLTWAYSVDIDQWTLLPRVAFPPGFEAPVLSHAAIDPGTGHVLLLMESAGTRTLWSYHPAWNSLTQLGGQVPAGRSGDPTLVLDPGAGRLVLVLWGTGSLIPGETWTFDLLTSTWTNQNAEPPGLPDQELDSSLLAVRNEATFDPVTQRTMVLMNGQLATYRTGEDHWDVIPREPGWPAEGTLIDDTGYWTTGPLARTGHSLVYDPVNQRVLVLGGTWRSEDGAQQSGDVWAYDPATNTWTQLVGPTTPEQLRTQLSDGS